MLIVAAAPFQAVETKNWTFKIWLLAGMQMVVAMGYSVTVTAAKVLIGDL